MKIALIALGFLINSGVWADLPQEKYVKSPQPNEDQCSCEGIDWGSRAKCRVDSTDCNESECQNIICQ